MNSQTWNWIVPVLRLVWSLSKDHHQDQLAGGLWSPPRARHAFQAALGTIENSWTSLARHAFHTQLGTCCPPGRLGLPCPVPSMVFKGRLGLFRPPWLTLAHSGPQGLPSRPPWPTLTATAYPPGRLGLPWPPWPTPPAIFAYSGHLDIPQPPWPCPKGMYIVNVSLHK